MINYKETLNLPNTVFSMRAHLVDSEPFILKRWNDDNLYELIHSHGMGRTVFLLHDGPPYVNGNIHLGHAVNKILKDIILKFKRLMGLHAPYVPGWDCHGLPIELQVLRSVGKPGIDISFKKFRQSCRSYAMQQVEKQKIDFMRLGIFGDWSNAYLTMNFKTEANIVRTLSKIITSGHLYKGNKPVYWCFKCASTLSELEIEYNHHHISCAIDVAFFIVDNVRLMEIFHLNFRIQGRIELIIWTTTPWTLPANQAIAVHPSYYYQLVSVHNKYIIIAADLVNLVMKRIRYNSWKVLGEVIGRDLEFLQCYHPFMSFQVPIVLSSHVSLDTSGTGVMHVAPNYGIDDYLIAQKYNFKITDIINDIGCYISNMRFGLDGLQVFQSNNVIVDLLYQSNALLCINDNYQHSYPYCWRHGVPVIFRATPQWFLSIDKNDLRKKLLKEINEVNWISKKCQAHIMTMVINRPDWCLSRQRIWGVPIPLFIHKKTESLHPRILELMEIVAKHIEIYGIEAWWDLNVKDIFDSEECDQYMKICDILDVWFDSGSIHDSVMPGKLKFLSSNNMLADLYLEGVDQYRGWFMSSLIISTIIQSKAPYKAVLTHGFVVDAQGKKMSKSTGNVISPQEIINKFGADILRLWVASTNYSKDMTISNDILEHVTDIYRRIRNTVRFCLGNLYDFNPEQDIVSPIHMLAIDRWAMHRAFFIQLKIISDYNHYCFHSVVKHIMKFCSVDMGAFYLDVIKDRQYTFGKKSMARRSCQTVLYHILEAMVRWISPILSFTSDEIWRCMPGKRSKYVFTEEWYNGLFQLDATEVMNNDYWNIFLNVRHAVNKKIEYARIDGLIGGSLETSVFLYATPELAAQLRMFSHELSFGLITSSAQVLDYDDDSYISRKSCSTDVPGLRIVLEKAQGNKCLRCWHYHISVGHNKNYQNICERCIINMFGLGEYRRFF